MHVERNAKCLLKQMDTPFTTKIESTDGESERERKRKRGGNCLNCLFLFYRNSPVPFTFRSNLARTRLPLLPLACFERTSYLVTPLSACDALSITLLTHTHSSMPAFASSNFSRLHLSTVIRSRISCFIYLLLRCLSALFVDWPKRTYSAVYFYLRMICVFFFLLSSPPAVDPGKALHLNCCFLHLLLFYL